MSDRIHQIASAVREHLRDGQDPANLILAIRQALRAERDDGHQEGYGDCLRDRWEADSLAEARDGGEDSFGTLDRDGRLEDHSGQDDSSGGEPWLRP